MMGIGKGAFCCGCGFLIIGGHTLQRGVLGLILRYYIWARYIDGGLLYSLAHKKWMAAFSLLQLSGQKPST